MSFQDSVPETPDDESQRIKKKIIEAASRLYEKKGFHETSVGEIAEAAGISVPVTYHYVRRKSDIMLLIMEDFTAQIRGRVLPEIENLEDPREKLAKAMEIFFSWIDANMVKAILVYRRSRSLDKEGRKKIMAAETEHTKVLEDIIKEGIDKGVFKPLDPDMAAYNILMIVHAWALKHWHFKRRYDLAEYARRQIEFFLAAITA